MTGHAGRLGVLLILLVITPAWCHAQDSLRFNSSNIRTYKDKFFLWPVIKQRTLNFELRPNKDNSPVMQFKPNKPVSIGFGMYVFDMSIEVAAAVPLAQRQENLYGPTTSRDLQVNIISRRFGADVMYQRYNGFYLNNSADKIPAGTPYPQRPDIRTSNLGVSGFYVFNHQRFSIRSAYTFADRQIRSSGSFLLSGVINSFELDADSTVLNTRRQQAVGLARPFSEIGYQTLSVAPGYSFNAIYRKLILNATLSVGPANHWVHYRDLAGNEHYDITINSFADVRFALGYNSDRFFGGLTFTTQARQIRTENIRFSNSSQSVRLMLGYRFNEFGILRRSVWDLAPILLKKVNTSSTK